MFIDWFLHGGSSCKHRDSDTEKGGLLEWGRGRVGEGYYTITTDAQTQIAFSVKNYWVVGR